MSGNNKIRGYSARKSASFNCFPVGPIRAVMQMDPEVFSLEFSEYNNRFLESQETKKEEEKGKKEK